MKNDQQVRAVFFWLALGASTVFCLVKYVDAKVSNAPWTIERPYVLSQIKEGFALIHKRLDTIDTRYVDFEKRVERELERKP